MDENRGKILIAGSLLLLVVAGVVLFLFVLPGINGSSPTMAQGAMPEGAPEVVPGAEAPGGGAPQGGVARPGPGPGGAPMGGAPGGPPMGAPGAMPAPGSAEPTAAAAPGAAPAVAAAPPPVVPPLEPSRGNPFLPQNVVLSATGKPATIPYVTHYGSNWSSIPITARLGFVRPAIPARAPLAPPAPEQGPAPGLTVTSILWTQDGQAMAVYESGPVGSRHSGVVKPGDVVDTWQVVEIWRDRVVIADRKTGKQQTVYLTTKAATPAGSTVAPNRGGAAAPAGGARPGRRLGTPGAPRVQ